jgi:hypothetical protein
LKEIRDSTNKYLLSIASGMKQREIEKKNLLILQQFEYENEISQYKIQMNIPDPNKNSLEERWKEFKNSLRPPQKLQILQSPDKPPRPPIQPRPQNENLQPSIHKLADINTGSFPMMPLHTNNNNILLNGRGDMSLATSVSSDIMSGKNFQNQQEIQRKAPKPKMNNPARTGRNYSIVKISDTQPLLLPEKPPQPEVFLKHRIRKNRANKLVIDRYIQSPNSFYPFDDKFNEIINRQSYYREDFGKYLI